MRNILKEKGQTINNINLGISRLLERKKILEEEKKELLDDVKFSRIKVDNKKQVELFLEKLQMMEHEKSLGAYESLLTSFLNEVLPGKRKVILDLKSSRQNPALNVYIEKSPGKKEDVLTGTGGSVTNIIVAGLRIIALLRSTNRKFLVLDEPDCWLEESNIPNFVKVIDELAKVLGVQVFLVSHSKLEDLSSIEHQVTLYQDENNSGKLETSWDSDPLWGDQDNGIKSIHLKNFQAHTDTFIPLSPGVTLFKGKNDIGKSAVVSALRSVFYGNGDETNIRHDTSKAEVIIEFSDNKRLLIWERKKTGSPKEIYTMYDESHSGNNPLHRTESASKIPDWLLVETGIGMVGDLDLQLSWQKNPISILGEKPSVRAQALAVGDEADIVQKMMSLSSSNMRESARKVKEGEIKLEKIRVKLLDLKNIEALNNENKILQQDIKSLEKSFIELEEINNIFNSINDYNKEKGKYNNLNNIVDNIVIPDNGNLIQEMKELYKNWSDNEKIKTIISFIFNEEDIEIQNLVSPDVKILYEKLSLLISEHNILKEIYKVDKDIENIICPEINSNILYMKDMIDKMEILSFEYNQMMVLNDFENIDLIIREDFSLLSDLINNIEKYEDDKNINSIEINDIIEEINILTETINKEFPVCPTCNKPWDDENHKNEKKVDLKENNIKDIKSNKSYF